MPALTAAAVRKQIASGRLDPVYVLLGDDDVEKSALAMEFAETVDEGLRPFNVDRFYGQDVASAAAIVEAANTLPMLAERRIVIVMQAEKVLEPRRESQAAARALAALLEYIQAPSPGSTLVLALTQLDRRTKLANLLLKHATVIESGALETLEDAARWVRAAFASIGMQAAPAAVRLLADRAGPDVRRLRADVERVALYAAGRRTVEPSDVLDVVGPAVATDDWALTRAIERGQTGAALRELELALNSGSVPPMVLGQLAWFVRTKMAPDRIVRVMPRILETDLALKSSGGDPGVLLARLVVELCGGAGGRPERSGRR